MPQVSRVFPPEPTGPGGSVLVILVITQQVLGVFRLADTARKKKNKKGTWGNMFCHSQLKVEIMLGCDCCRNDRNIESLGLEKDP